MTTKIEAYVFNNSCFDKEKISRINVRWCANRVKEEVELGDYNPEPDGKPGYAGRIYEDKRHAEECIINAGTSSCFFVIELPSDSVIGRFADPLNEQVKYLKIKEQTIPNVVGLQTVSNKYNITPEFNFIDLSESTSITVPEKVEMQQKTSRPLRELFPQLNRAQLPEVATVDVASSSFRAR